MISIIKYDDENREGTSCYVHWLCLGGQDGRWHIEIGKHGIAIFLGPIILNGGWTWNE